MGYYTTLILIVLGCAGVLYFLRYMFDISWWLFKASIWIVALYVILKFLVAFFSSII